MMTPLLTRRLASLGALPFIACAILSLAGITDLPFLGDPAMVEALYGLTIASFMAGVHWGTALNRDRHLPVNLFITSNIVAVAAWVSVLLAGPGLALVALSILFAYLLFIDHRLFRLEVIDRPYWQTRLWITAIVIACLVVTAATRF